MSKHYWITSDYHLGHSNILTFKRSDGTPLRSFSTIEEHDEIIIQNHNKVVKPDDKVYNLGDVTFKNQYLKQIGRLFGHQKLIRGNHDKFKASEYLKYFKDICAIQRLTNDELCDFSIVLSHIPLHPDCINGRFGFNVHGHLHSNMINDPRYINVCVENTNYMPVNLEELRDNYRKVMHLFPTEINTIENM